MNGPHDHSPARAFPPPDDEEAVDRVEFHFEIGRRAFLQLAASGLFVAVALEEAPAQERGGRGRPRGRGGAAVPLNGRLHIGNDGSITVLTGKVECGQGSRAQLTQAAAEELRINPERVSLVMADTGLVPDDGGTAGSRTTPSTVPAIRNACAAAREILAAAAARTWNVDVSTIAVRDGAAHSANGDRRYAYTDLASDEQAAKELTNTAPDSVSLTSIAEWKTLGQPLARPNGRDLVTGAHRYPSDIIRPGMLYGTILRRPSYTAQLVAIDLAEAQAMEGVTIVRDGEFIGAVAPTSWAAQQAVAVLKKSARWESSPHPASATLSQHLRDTAQGLPANPHAAEMAKAAHALRDQYEIAYVQHCPMEPRAAVAEWDPQGKLTVWTGTQMPFRVRGELAGAFRMPEDKVRVIVPDFGGGFGGKHSGECAVEAARLAKTVGKPVHLRWTREEEFTWAYFRPAAAIDAEASLDANGRLTSWHFLNINAGGNGIDSPYTCGKKHTRSVRSDAPLRHGSYRSLAVTGNNFARECIMDELALAAGQDPLAFRLAHLEAGRLRDVLVAAAEKFDFEKRWKTKAPGTGVGLACGLDKGSFVAACAEITVVDKTIHLTRVCQAYECGKILNPTNLRAQVEGAIIMGLGPALHEAIAFADGKLTNAAFSRYRVPHFEDLPQLDIHLLDRPDLPSVGAGETPLIVVAPAIGNAVFHATGQRLRSMPLRLA